MWRLRKFRGLSPARRRRLLEMVVLLGIIQIALRVLPFRVVRRLLAGLAQPRRRSARVGLDPVAVESVVWAATAAGRRMLGDHPCLPRALAVHFVLTRCGYLAQLRIGVAKDPAGRLQAHAWVESGGVIVVGGPASFVAHYAPLPNLDGAMPWGR
ncbi:MAG TPA: lasso peptide biosynthesis B2 protein [Chloroflexota bacterium]|nr:lasso peptide biosynthesis B2 protein [Chloroflexota bacterium]